MVFCTYNSFVMEYLTTKEVAEKLGINVSRVHVLINEGRLPAKKFGRSYMILESDLELVRERKTGRPPKAKVEK
jgi:excisionase family DNA binding protein